MEGSVCSGDPVPRFPCLLTVLSSWALYSTPLFLVDLDFVFRKSFFAAGLARWVQDREGRVACVSELKRVKQTHEPM